MQRTIYSFLILLILFLPLAQKYIRMPKQDYELNGAYETTSATTLSIKGFMEGSYQDNITAYLQENIGFKGYLIALKNQIDYSLFDKLNYGIEKGADGQLFYWNHIDVHCGHLSLTEDSLKRKVRELGELKNVLDGLHVPVVYVLAPGKPFYYEEKLPPKFKGNCSEDNDYHHLLRLMRESKFPVIDFNAWFKDIGEEHKHPLFPRLGTHWSYYGACIANDSLAKYVEHITGQDLPDYRINSDSVSTEPYKTDKDLWSLLNLLFPMKSDTLSYPRISFNPRIVPNKKMKVLFIGDSFNWTLLDTKMPGEFFSDDSRFWFYKRQLYDLHGKWITDNPDEVNLYSVLNGTDMVIFLSTEVLYHRVDFGLSNALLSNQSAMDSLLNKN